MDNEDAVKIKNGLLVVKAKDQATAKKIVLDWYRKKAEQKLNEIAQPLILRFIRKYKLSIIHYPLSIRDMPTRWGSCTPKGKIILNPELIKAPKGCIEYVIIHELCHLIHHDHTQKFIDLQTKEMKDWKKWKMKLEKLLA